MILIRADANEKIGTGHVMRCLSIARSFVAYDQEVLFVTADHKGDGLISSAGFKFICMDSEWTEMDKEPIEDVISNYHPSLLLVDSYFVTTDYFRRLSYYTRVGYIDDLNVTLWDVDYLINYNIFGTMLDYGAYEKIGTQLFLGPRYAPLRSEFQDIPKHFIKPVSDIMVSAGGSDPQGIMEKLMDGMCPLWPDMRFHFIVGSLNPRLEKIKKMAINNIVLHINERNMSRLMRSCDIAISAAGSTLYELCACGTPTITYTIADNQLMAADEFEQQGVMISAGDFRENEHFIKGLEKKLRFLIDNIDKRQELSGRMQSLVDGRGADRLTTALINHMTEEALKAIRDEDSL